MESSRNEIYEFHQLSPLVLILSSARELVALVLIASLPLYRFLFFFSCFLFPLSNACLPRFDLTHENNT